MQIVEVLIEYSTHALNRPFSYLNSSEKNVGIGYRVLVSFNQRELVGYVTNVIETQLTAEQIQEDYGFKLEYIIDVIDESPLLNEELITLADKVTDYYLSTKIKMLQCMLPPSLSPRRGSLKAPKIAYNQYLVIKNDDENDLTSKQIEILRFVKRESKVLKSLIPNKSIVDKLISLDRLMIVKEEKRRLSLPDYSYVTPPKLNEEQENVIKEFKESTDKVFLLQGVTGSGKTEIYLTLSEHALKEDKGVLMLVPEISLTPMMVEYYLRRFKGKVAVLHSELTAAEKYDEYRKIASGQCNIVVGARSAIFAPIHNLGLIIIDEEHTESYKQDVEPFYHAREVAILRSELIDCKVLLGSATPSLESRARAQNGLYHLLKLEKRANNYPLPNTTIINLLDYKNIDRDSSIFSIQLRKALKQTLENKEQAILLINRRGFSSNVSCRSCGHVFKCPSCGIPLTYHKSDNMLKCHHCDHVELMPEACPKCGSKYLMKTGFGTERIEDEIHRLFPEARTLRLDSDSAKNKNKTPLIIESFRNEEADILIGTQMIAKGHDFPKVTLVGAVLADLGLNMPNYRASERTFQLITQAIGRAGRSDRRGKAIIQTYSPSHYAITLAARQDYEYFYKNEMQNRKMLSYPPYSFLSAINLSSKNEQKVISEAYSVVDYLNNQFNGQATIIGPSKPYIDKVRDDHFRSILIKSKNIYLVRAKLGNLITLFASKSNIKITIDIDPYNF